MPSNISFIAKDTPMIRSILAGSMLIATAFAPQAMSAQTEQFRAVLSGFNEIGELNAESGAIFSAGHGSIELSLDPSAQTISYKLTYSNLSSAVTQAHIHFGKVHTPGGVMVFLCSNLPTAPAGTQACPNSGTVTGTISASDIQAITGQGIVAGVFAELEDAIESHTTYTNVHTTNFPSGEIRGEIAAPIF
jgi:hypothetical protein